MKLKYRESLKNLSFNNYRYEGQIRMEKLRGYWTLKLSELTEMKKAEVEIVKLFISRTDDKYRASYVFFMESHPHQCIIVGTTNSQGGFLRDITGNRRYWPVKVNGDSKKKIWNITKEVVDQIWDETLVYYKKGEIFCFRGKDEAMANKEQSDSMESDEREGLVRDYLDILLPTDWDKMDLYERRNFLRGWDFCDKDEIGIVNLPTKGTYKIAVPLSAVPEKVLEGQSL